MNDPLAQIRDQLALDDAELDELRQQGLADPMRGMPMTVHWRGVEMQIEPGKWTSQYEGYLDENRALPANCPVTPLGQDEKFCYFLSPLGHVRTLSDSNAGKTAIVFLFGGRTRYLEWAWPRYGKHGIAGWAAEDALPDLVNACAWKGAFALEDQIRGRGAWRDVDGGLIYHAGDRVWIGGRWERCGEHGDHIYPARPKIGRPAARYEPEGEGSPGDALFKVLETFNFDRGELDARLVLGWVMTAMVGGALVRRPVIFVNGEEGSGKSTLQELLRLLLNDALVSTSNTTQAGIYQRVRQDSIAILVDELESKEDTRVVDRILELARIAYSGDKMQRGGQDGVGKEFALMSSFMGSSIAKPSMGAQDESRMAAILLRPLKAKDGKKARAIDAKTIEAWFKGEASSSPVRGNDVALWGRQLLKRWFDWWPRWDGLHHVFHQALMEAGHSSRGADTFAPLAAAYHVAMRDTLPTPEEIAQWLAWLKPDVLEETSTREKTWRQCFMHMLQARPRYLEHESMKSVGDALQVYKKTNAQEDVETRLARSGLAISWGKGPGGTKLPETFETARLFVPAKHPALHALFEGTPWAGSLGRPGPWIGVLRQMPPHLWENGKCEKGLDAKASGIFIDLAKALAE